MPPSPLLESERQRSGLPARELTYVLHGGRANVERMERLEALLAADPVFANTQEMYYLPRDKQYELATRMAGRAEVIARRNKLDEDDTALLHTVLHSFTACPSSTALHVGMFFKNLALLFTDEQQAKWMDLAKQWRMIGCYAQTELGHGSNVRALETTATFLPDSDEFEIHSPTLTSLKWWPGALARTANFGVVYARLILADGKDYGVHNFMVQLRDLETHAPMPGVTLGDVGPKIGFNNVDNGYARFTRVRIPREQMGMRVSKVTRDGKYVKQAGVPKEVLYFTMLQTRMVFVRQSGVNLAKASTIAIRYSAVRRQGYDAAIPNATEELQVLDYQTQQFRLLPLLAGAYAIMLTGNRVDQFAIELSAQTKSGDVRLLNVGHAMSCGLKVLCTELSNAGLETCRRACGGHGYLLASGLPVLLGDQVQTVTTEGDNYVLTQQTARALLKILADFKTGKTAAPPMLESLVRLDQPVPVRSTTADWREPATYVAAFEQRFLHLLRAFVNTMATEPSVAVGVQRHSVACFALSNAYANLLLVKNFADAVRSTATLSGSSASLDVLRLLSHLFALSQLQQDAGEFMESGAVVAQDMPVVRSTIEALLLELRPHAVKLVDGFNFSDRTLNSALGRGDGNVYEALYASAQLDPLNGGDAAASGEVARRELLLPIREELSRLSRL